MKDTPRKLNGIIHPADVNGYVEKLFKGDYMVPTYQRFKEEAESAGFKVEDYSGRFGYFGPGVVVDDEDEYQELVRSTSVRLQWDNMGKTGKIVYPK